MENSYKKVIERAILSGIISEDSKHTYLAGILDENDSGLSEIESLLNMEKDENSCSHAQPENKCISKEALLCSDKNTNRNKLIEMKSSDSCDNHSLISGSTVENYRILALKNPKNENSIADDYVSEAFSPKHENAKEETNKNMKSTALLSKPVKKPVKDQTLTFNIPIYMGVKKKKSTIKPRTLNFENVTQYDISKMYCGKSGSSRLKTNGKVRNVNKLTLPKTKIAVTKKQDISPKCMKKFVDVSSARNSNDENYGDYTGYEYYGKEKSVKSKAQSFSSGKKVLENQKENSQLVSKYLKTELEGTAQDYDRHIYTISTRRKLKVKDNLVNTKKRYKTKEDYSMDMEAYNQLDENKNERKTQIPVSSKADEYRRCGYCNECMADNTRVLNDKKITETNNEDTFSFDSNSTEESISGKDHRKLLNVNIICQFSNDDKDDVTNNGSIPFSQTTNGVSKQSVKETKTLTENVPETGKSKKNNKIHFLSRLFANMKIKKKPN